MVICAKKKGALVAMAGLSGSGKSTTAQWLARQSGAIRLRSDAVRKHLAGISIHEKGSDDIYTAEMSAKTYARLISLGVDLASMGYNVILDAKFDRQAVRHRAIAATTQSNLALTFLHCTAPPNVLKERVAKRSGDIADATVAILAKQHMEPFTVGAQVITLDTTAPKADIQQVVGGVFA